MSAADAITKPKPEELQSRSTPKPKKKSVRYRDFRKRQFLNLPDRESDAYISVHLKNDKWDGYSIRITDCNEKITLHGGLDKLKSRKNALHKVDALIETLQELREHMVSEFKRNNIRF